MNETFVDRDDWTWYGDRNGMVRMTYNRRGEPLSENEELMPFLKADREFGPLRRVGEE